MARRTRGIMSNQYVMYGLYGIAAYYGYQWLMGQPIRIPFINPAPLPEPQVSAFPQLGYYP